jgi:hypothetical protein
MRKNKKNNSAKPSVLENISNDQFIRRIQVQSKIIKKILGEIDLPAKPEDDLLPENKSEQITNRNTKSIIT